MKPALAVCGVAAASFLAVGAMSFDEEPAVPKAPKDVNYAEHVAPILNAKCVECHRPNEVAPFSLQGYENAKKWSAMIALTTETKRMPPWKAVHGFGEFEDAKVLSPEQVAILKAWDKAGAPQGDKSKEPKPPTFNPDWLLGKPDIELKPSKPFKLGAEGEDVYRNFVFELKNQEPMWISAMDVQPGNKKIVHHVIAFITYGDKAQKVEAKSNDGQEGYTSSGGGIGTLPDGSLGGWAPGVRARMSPDGIAFKVQPNATIVMQVHYHKSGKPEQDQTKIGLYKSRKPVEKELMLNWLFNFGIDIPAGEANYVSRKEFTFRRPMTVYGTMPHMHLLGRKMKSWFVLPDGKEIPLIQIEDWDFNWQLQYQLKEPIKIPAGTKQIVEAVYDNSSDNPRNPSSPPKRVRWGEQTEDEMFLLITAVTLD